MLREGSHPAWVSAKVFKPGFHIPYWATYPSASAPCYGEGASLHLVGISLFTACGWYLSCFGCTLWGDSGHSPPHAGPRAGKWWPWPGGPLSVKPLSCSSVKTLNTFIWPLQLTQEQVWRCHWPLWGLAASSLGCVAVPGQPTWPHLITGAEGDQV